MDKKEIGAEIGALSFTRHVGQSFKIITPSGDLINVTFKGQSGFNQIKLGINADRKYRIYRDEIFTKILYENDGSIPGTNYKIEVDHLGNR